MRSRDEPSPPNPLAPFGPGSRTGLEIELLAPKGASRFDLAEVLAQTLGGRVEYGLKHLFQGRAGPAETGLSHLVLSARVLDARGELFATLVDDPSLVEGLDAGAPPGPIHERLAMDDVRFAAWLERRARAASPSIEVLLAPLLETFEAGLCEAGAGEAGTSRSRQVRDFHDNLLATIEPYGGERERICEVVTRPLTREERTKQLARVLSCAQACGFLPAADGGLHVHLDAAPWRTTPRLRQLILDYAALRPELLERLRPNPRSADWRGAFPEWMVVVARDTPPGLSFDRFAASLVAGGAVKRQDFNLLGVLREKHPQSTLEFRALPATLDLRAIVEGLEFLEEFLTRIALRGDERGVGR